MIQQTQDILDQFNQRMERLGTADRRQLLHGVYKQLVPSRNGNISYGEYRYVLTCSMGQEAYLLTHAELAEEGREEAIRQLSPSLAPFESPIMATGEEMGAYARRLEQAARLENETRHEFKERVANELYRHGLEDQGRRFLVEHFSELTAARMEYALAQLQRADSFWREYAEINISWKRQGIQIRCNGWGLPGAAGSYRASILLDDGSFGHESMLFEICPVFDGKSLTQLDLADDDIIYRLDLGKALAIARAERARDETRFKEAVADAVSSPIGLPFQNQV